MRRHGRRTRRPGAIALGALAALGAAGVTGCGQDCCTVDSMPIPVTRAPRGDGMPGGAVLAQARVADGASPSAPFNMVVDTGSPVTILAGAAAGGALTPGRHGFDLLDPMSPDPDHPRVRARFRDIGVFTLPLGAVGDPATAAGGVLGGDLLRGFSIEFRLAGPCAGGPAGATCSAITFWPHQGASVGFLGDAGYAVLRFNLFGGGETTARTAPDTLGLRAPVDLPATRVVLRGCAAPRAFSPTEPRELCCARGDELEAPRKTGADVSLLLATGAGPLVLSRSAWNRVKDQLPAPPAATCLPDVAACPKLLLPTWPIAIDAEWQTIPRLALVDGSEPPSTGDEGPCVDLGRSRRIEWVAVQQQAAQAAGAGEAACVQLCDTDPREANLAQNSAAYVELGGALPVAVIEDAEPFLQALRFDIRPEGPEIDGLVGAGALGAARLELNYGGDPAQAIFSCEPTATRDTCYAAPRCPRLPDLEQAHLCFGLPSHRLPAACSPSGC